MRPVGALLFGLWQTGYGRRIPLWYVIYLSDHELLCGFAAEFQVFLILRALLESGWAGSGAVGARWRWSSAGSVAWNSQRNSPKRLFDRVSSCLSSARFLLPAWGWRPMFWDWRPARASWPLHPNESAESEAWEQHRRRVPRRFEVVARDGSASPYLVVVMFS